jgi:hypothetical protein
MAISIVDDGGGVSMDALLMEVLNSDSSFGAEMRDKVSSTLDTVTSKIEQGVGAMTFSKEPINISSLTGISDAEKDRTAKEFAKHQKKMLVWIKEVSSAANWKQIRKGANINDIFTTDKVANERFEREYRKLQRQILAAVKANIPTKVDSLPPKAVLASKAVKPKKEAKPKKEEPETIAKANEDTDPSKKKSSFISGILDKMGIKKGREDFNEDPKPVIVASFGKEAVKQLSKALPSKDEKEVKKMKIKKPSTGFLKTLLKAAGITALLGLVTYLAKNPEKWEDAKVFFKETFVPWLKNLPTMFGNLIDNFGDWITEDAIPMVKKIRKYFSEDFKHDFNGMVAAISSVISSVGNTIGNFKKAAEGELVNIPDGKWWQVNLLDRVMQIGQGLGYAASYTIDWLASLPAKFDEMTTFWGSKMLKAYEAIGNGWDKMTSFIADGMLLTKAAIEEKIFAPISSFAQELWEGIKEMGTSIKDTILEIPDFIRDMFEKVKSGFINQLNKIPGVNITTGEDSRNAAKFVAGSEAKVGRPLTEDEKSVQLKLAKGQELSADEIVVYDKLRKDKKMGELEKANTVPVAPGEKQDFIYRPGQPIQSFSGQDVLIGAKEKLIVENKNLDKQMHDLTAVMELIKGKFDELLSLNMEMLKRGASQGPKHEPLPAIAAEIGTYRALAHDEALNHKTKVWELLHGV